MKSHQKKTKPGDVKLSKKILPELSDNEDGASDLGQDSDHSSNPLYHRFNHDNDVISYGEENDGTRERSSPKNREGRLTGK